MTKKRPTLFLIISLFAFLAVTFLIAPHKAKALPPGWDPTHNYNNDYTKCAPSALIVNSWTKNNVDYRLLQVSAKSSAFGGLVLQNSDCYFGPLNVTSNNSAAGLSALTPYFSDNGRFPTYARLGFGGDMPEATQPAQAPINNRSIEDNPREYYGNGNGLAGGFVDDGAWVKINGKMIICQGIDDPAAPACQPIVTKDQGNAGHLFVEDNCPGGITGYMDLKTAKNPSGLVQCQDPDTFNWYRPYIGSPELTNKGIFAQDPITHEIKDFSVEFYVRNTQPPGYNSAFFIVIGFARCDDGSLPPGGDYTKCPGGVPTGGGGGFNKQCLNYPGQSLTATFTPPANALSVLNYSYTIQMGSPSQVIASGNTSAGAVQVPLTSIPDIFKNADVYPANGSATATYTYIDHYDPVYDSAGKQIGANPVILTTSGPAGVSFDHNPWPTSNIGCANRHFDLTPSLPNPALYPDNEEPTKYQTPGSINVVLTKDDIIGSHPLIVNATTKLDVTGNLPGTRSATYAFPDNPGSPNVSLNTILAAFGPNPTDWPIVTPPKGGQQYCALLTITAAKGLVDVNGTPYNVDAPGYKDTNPPQCQSVVDRPYMKAFNGDIRATFVKTWARQPSFITNPGYRGSSVQFAAFIMNGGMAGGIAQHGLVDNSDGTTKGFYTASQRTQTGGNLYPCASNGLLASNTNTAPNPICPITANPWGGEMVESQTLADWWGSMPANVSSNPNRQVYITMTGPSSPNNGSIDVTNPPPAGNPAETYYYYADGQSYSGGTGCPLAYRPEIGTKPRAQCYELFNNMVGAAPGPNSTIVPPGKHITLFINGDFKVFHNICYVICDGSAGYTSIEDMPYLTVIVKGSIFIEKSVTRMDGLFVALKNPAIGDDADTSTTRGVYHSGTIYTCTNFLNEPLRSDVPRLSGDPFNADFNFPANRVINECNKPLVINGALIAETAVEFWRNANSLRNSRINDASSNIAGSPAACPIQPALPRLVANNNCAAEEINFIPELLLSKPALKGSQSGLDLDTFSGLPPIF